MPRVWLLRRHLRADMVSMIDEKRQVLKIILIGCRL